MKISVLTAFFAAAMVAAAGPAAAQQAQPAQPGMKIGVVSFERILRESAPALRATKILEGDIQKRDDEMRGLAAQLKRLEDALERSPTPLSEADRRSKAREFETLSREFERKKQVYSDELNQRRNDMMGQLLEQANRAVRQIAERENLDAVFQEAAYASPRIDLTDKVIKALETATKPPAKPAAK